MSNTFRQPGHIIDVPAPTGGVVTGTPIRLEGGPLLAVPESTAAAGVQVAMSIAGVHELPADSGDTIALGELVDFDASSNTIQPGSFTTGTGDITGCGVCVKAKGSGETTVWVLINTGQGAAV